MRRRGQTGSFGGALEIVRKFGPTPFKDAPTFPQDEDAQSIDDQRVQGDHDNRWHAPSMHQLVKSTEAPFRYEGMPPGLGPSGETAVRGLNDCSVPVAGKFFSDAPASMQRRLRCKKPERAKRLNDIGYYRQLFSAVGTGRYFHSPVVAS